MRPRFRAWLKKKKKMVATDDLVNISFEDEEICVQTLYFEEGLISERDLDYYEFDEIELMQSTGLFDKNNKEIFEGDILGTKGGLLNGIVEYRTDLGMWTNSLLRYNNFERLCSIASDREIIGNVWEDGDLIDGKKTNEN